MNTQATERSEIGQSNQTADSFFHRHRQYFFGLLSGLGFGVFVVEVFRHQKNPLLYIGGLFLMVLGGILYRSFRDS